MASASTRVSSDDAPPPLPRPSLSRMSARSALASRASSRSGNLPRRARRSGMGRSNARGGGAVDGVGDPAARPATTSSRRSGELPTSPCICVTLCSLSPWSLLFSRHSQQHAPLDCVRLAPHLPCTPAQQPVPLVAMASPAAVAWEVAGAGAASVCGRPPWSKSSARLLAAAAVAAAFESRQAPAATLAEHTTKTTLTSATIGPYIPESTAEAAAAADAA